MNNGRKKVVILHGDEELPSPIATSTNIDNTQQQPPKDNNIDIQKGLVPEELANKISQISQAKGNIEYSDFSKPQIRMDGIPSNNIFYSNDATGMPLMVHDMMMLEAMASDPNITDSVLNFIFNKYTNIHPMRILEGDEIYILMWLRSNTFPDSPFIYSFECSKCKKRHVNKVLSIDDAIFKKLPEWYHKGYSIQIGSSNFAIKPRTRGAIIEKNKYISSTNKKLDAGDLHILDMALCIDAPLNIAIAMIENMDPAGLPELYNIISIIKGFGFTGKFDAKCEGCGASNPALFRFRERFYIPEPQGYRLNGDAV